MQLRLVESPRFQWFSGMLLIRRRRGAPDRDGFSPLRVRGLIAPAAHFRQLETDILTGGAHVAPPSSSSSMPRFSGTRRSPSISRFGSVIEGGNLEMVYPGSTASGDLGLLLLSAVDMEGGSRRYGRAAAVGFVNGPSSERAAATGLRRFPPFASSRPGLRRFDPKAAVPECAPDD
jgi:hypothetical protein